MDVNDTYKFTATLANGTRFEVTVRAAWFAQAKERALAKATRESKKSPVVSLSRNGQVV